MNQATDTVIQAADRLYKSHYGKIVSALLQFSPGIQLETVEDIVHDSFAAALTAWQKESVPANPAGWVYTVCRNKILNTLKKDKKVRPLSDTEDFYGIEPIFTESFFDDYQLRLLFACAHPDLSPKVQVVITLKYVANLKVEAIAKALGMTIDGIDKLLLRARQKIKTEQILLAEPPIADLGHRLTIVHKIIYLIYNEGYKPSTGNEILKEELCEEALLMNKALLDSGAGNSDTRALHALMLFSAARFKTRFGSTGQLLDLEEQNRDLWDQNLIKLASDFLNQSRSGTISTYHYEASIAWLHCTAKNFRATDWRLISKLYFQLLQMNPNPFVELNYAIALYYAGEKKKALTIFDKLQQQPLLNKYYLLNAALGKIHLLEGNNHKAKEYFLETLKQTNVEAEREFIRRMIDKSS